MNCISLEQTPLKFFHIYYGFCIFMGFLCATHVSLHLYAFLELFSLALLPLFLSYSICFCFILCYYFLNSYFLMRNRNKGCDLDGKGGREVLGGKTPIRVYCVKRIYFQ